MPPYTVGSLFLPEVRVVDLNRYPVSLQIDRGFTRTNQDHPIGDGERRICVVPTCRDASVRIDELRGGWAHFISEER